MEDFEGTTLGAIPGLLGRLRYIAELHDGHGGYAHWGMGRVHGEHAARRAIRASHSAVVGKLLRTPLRELMEDLASSARAVNAPAPEFLHSLQRISSQALPPGIQAAAQKHLMAVLHALSALTQNQARASHPGASPPLPPGR